MSLIGDHSLIVVDAVERRRQWIAEPVILDQLVAKLLKLLQIGARRVHDRGEFVIDEADIAIEVQCSEIPVWVIEYREPEKVIRANA